ncbi:MAG TPA: hypothetical protein VHZ51_05785 [Ktedonobacteraceae bacterium]|jgi:hypothetical protein|nr:hypothetical protein [Ktedonobacteraceae bacterium]
MENDQQGMLDEEDTVILSQNEHSEQLGAISERLATLLAFIHTYFDERIDHEDLTSFNFCLQRLFSGIDMLYIALLPELKRYTAQQQRNYYTLPNQGQVQSEQAANRYYIWVCLQKVKHQLERIEAHCQLANNLAVALLEALTLHEPAANEQPVALLPTISREQWKNELAVVTDRVGDWQHKHGEQGAFSMQFAGQLTSIPTLAHMDTAFDLLLDNASAIFGTILADFRAVTPGDDEVLATLLLDIMQKNDLLLWHIDVLLEPLSPLLKQFTVNTRVTRP